MPLLSALLTSGDKVVLKSQSMNLAVLQRSLPNHYGKMRKQMREITYNDYKQHEGEIMQGTVERFDQRFIYVNLGTLEAQLSRQD